MIPKTCKDGLAEGDIMYFMRVGCKSDNILVFGKATLKKEVVAMIVVFSDLFVSVLLFVMFSFLRSMQNTTAQEIDDAEITAKDFGVEIRGLPNHESVREFKSSLWQWIEQMNEKAPDELN
jgi:hypothetical protein